MKKFIKSVIIIIVFACLLTVSVSAKTIFIDYSMVFGTIKGYAIEPMAFIFNNGYYSKDASVTRNVTTANDKVSRGAFIQMFTNIAKSGDSTIQPADASVFSDISGTVSTDNPGGKYGALYAKSIGFVEGANSKFNGDSLITREEAAKICIAFIQSICSRNNLSSPITESNITFTDTYSISSWALPYVKDSVSCGIFKGDEKGRFSPKSNLTWNDSFVVIYRTYQALYNVGYRTDMSIEYHWWLDPAIDDFTLANYPGDESAEQPYFEGSLSVLSNFRIPKFEVGAISKFTLNGITMGGGISLVQKDDSWPIGFKPYTGKVKYVLPDEYKGYGVVKPYFYGFSGYNENDNEYVISNVLHDDRERGIIICNGCMISRSSMNYGLRPVNIYIFDEEGNKYVVLYSVQE